MRRSTRVPVPHVASRENTFPNAAFKHDFKHIGWFVFQLHAKQAQLEKHQDVTFQIRPYSSSMMGCFYLICKVIEYSTERGSILRLHASQWMSTFLNLKPNVLKNKPTTANIHFLYTVYASGSSSILAAHILMLFVTI